MRVGNQLFSKRNLSQNKQSQEEKHERAAQRLNLFLFPGFILEVSNYLELHDVINLRQISRSSREISSYVINICFLKKEPKLLLYLERIPFYLQFYAGQLPTCENMSDDIEMSSTTSIDIPLLNANQASVLVDNCREIKEIQHEYKAALDLDLFRGIKRVVSNTYNKFTGNNTFKYSLALLFSLPFCIFMLKKPKFSVINETDLTALISVAACTFPLIEPWGVQTTQDFRALSNALIQQAFSPIFLFKEFLGDSISSVFSSIRDCRVQKVEAKLEQKANQFENQAVFWASLPRTERGKNSMQSKLLLQGL